MKSLRKMLAATLVAGSAAAALPAIAALGGCYASEGAYVVEESPPPVRNEVVVYRPGYLWVHGHWARSGPHWAWRSGYYERERPNQVFVEGRWERRGRGHVWVDGGWRARAGVSIR